MPLLSRRAPKLLTRVKNKRHASPADHYNHDSTSNHRPGFKRPRHTSEAEGALPGCTASPARLDGDMRLQPQPEFKRPAAHSEENREGEQEAGAEADADRERPRFVLPSSSLEMSTTTSQTPSARFQMPGGGPTTSRSRLSSLSSLHSNPLADHRTPDATMCPPSPEALPPPECSLCGHPVAPGEREMFADEARIPRGLCLDYRWQKRFCLWHRRRAAAARFVAEGYPAIDWQGLETRMRGHAVHLEAVIKDDVPSQHRARLMKRQRRRPRAGVMSVVDRAPRREDDDDDDDA